MREREERRGREKKGERERESKTRGFKRKNF